MNTAHRTTVALYGGAFDPPHVAHVMSVAAVLSAYPVEAVWVLPVYLHPLGKAPTPWVERLALCRDAFAIFGDRVQVREDERLVGGAGRTLDLLHHLQRGHQTKDFRLVIGSDQLTIRHKWHRFDEICRLAPPIVLGRPGHPVPPPFSAAITMPQWSSTDARAALARGELPTWLPHAVRARIQRQGLYGTTARGAAADLDDA